ncbi:MAG: hypothetical protein KGH64_01610 [Candidatus Micrarchaeota archaeon]|nr:hypothetical protein [Candidatus Micrarchaeota archaeon]MDE1834013.1 hypothetical protein [Candidatus Micrarchaeota archaeon]MDE1859478.1 hypothetical protein [Candidatus Micrarchaeota archaeon]
MLRLLRRDGTLRISLDIDVTIARIHKPILEELNTINAAKGTPTFYTEDTHMTQYDWSGVGESWSTIKPLYDHVWVNRHHEIELLADVSLIYGLCAHYKVELVTQKDDHITSLSTELWLRKHGLGGLNLNILANGEDRVSMGFEIYIDDNPALVAKVKNCEDKVLFLVTRRQNEQEEADGKKIIRVPSVDHASKMLLECVRASPRRRLALGR